MELAQERVTLDSSQLTVASMIQQDHSTSALFVWTVRSYSKLDNGVLYYQTNNETNCTFKLLKTPHILFVATYNNVSRTHMKFYILGLEDEIYARDGLEIKECVYVADFCSKMISDRNKKFLVDDTICIHCVYFIRKCEGTTTVAPYGQWRYKCCTNDLRNNLTNLYETSHDHDFIIRAEGKTFNVHKLILAARSRYFSEIFRDKEKESIDIGASADRVHDVLHYIYTGELKGRNVVEMLQIFDISKTWKVNCLSDKCETFLTASLNASNTMDIVVAALENGSVDLKAAALDYFRNSADEFVEYEEAGEILHNLSNE